MTATSQLSPEGRTSTPPEEISRGMASAARQSIELRLGAHAVGVAQLGEQLIEAARGDELDEPLAVGLRHAVRLLVAPALARFEIVAVRDAVEQPLVQRPGVDVAPAEQRARRELV